MPHGGPDWGTLGPLGTVYTVEDMAELAVRLGSIATFDRRGNVIWFDDFEDTLKRWTHSSFGAEGDFIHTAEAARNGSFSAKVLSPTTIDKDTWVYCYRPLPVQSKIGFEFSYSMYLQIKYIEIALLFGNSAGQYEYRLRYDRYNTTMAYLDSPGSYTNLTGTPSHQTLSYAWNTIKLVADYENQEYVRALLNNLSWDLKNIPGSFNPGAYTPSLTMEARITNRQAGQHYIYLDDIILTQNEP